MPCRSLSFLLSSPFSAPVAAAAIVAPFVVWVDMQQQLPKKSRSPTLILRRPTSKCVPEEQKEGEEMEDLQQLKGYNANDNDDVLMVL